MSKPYQTNVNQVFMSGDFNFKDIDWAIHFAYGEAESEYTEFLDICYNSYLHQHVRNFICTYGSENPLLLDLIPS